MCAPCGARMCRPQSAIKVKVTATKYKITAIKVNFSAIEVNLTAIKVRDFTAVNMIRARVKYEKY